MKTRKLYQENVYLSTFSAKIVSISNNLIELDQSAFFPTGGGQSCDKGTINGLAVSDVFEKNYIVYHKVENHDFKLGDIVEGKIDYAHRFDNMQRHCGEHIMSGVWHRMYNGVNKGFHMGDDYMTIDIKLPNNIQMSQDIINKVEIEVNKDIWANLPVTTHFFDNKDDASKQNVRKAVSIEENITLVSVGDTDNPSDCVACCGTHPNSTGQVGLLKIIKWEKNHDMYRIYFEAGNRAFNIFKDNFKILSFISNKLSAGNKDIESKFKAFWNRQKELANENKLLKNKLLDFYERNLTEHIFNKQIVPIHISDMDKDDLIHFGKRLIDKTNGILFLYSDDNFILLFSTGNIENHCGNFINSVRSKFDFKGGGGSNSAQMQFNCQKEKNRFITYLNSSI